MRFLFNLLPRSARPLEKIFQAIKLIALCLQEFLFARCGLQRRSAYRGKASSSSVKRIVCERMFQEPSACGCMTMRAYSGAS